MCVRVRWRKLVESSGGELVWRCGQRSDNWGNGVVLSSALASSTIFINGVILMFETKLGGVCWRIFKVIIALVVGQTNEI